MVPDYLIVDNFEVYDVGNNEIWWSWKDGPGYGSGRFTIQSGHCGSGSTILYVRCHFKSQRPFSFTLSTEPSIMQI